MIRPIRVARPYGSTVFLRRDKVDPERFSKNTRDLFALSKEWWIFQYYMVISQPFVIQSEERPVWIREFPSYHSAAGFQKRAETRHKITAEAGGSVAHNLIDSFRIRAPTPTILIFLTSVNHFRSNDVKNSPLLTVVFDIVIHASFIYFNSWSHFWLFLAISGRFWDPPKP